MFNNITYTSPTRGKARKDTNKSLISNNICRPAADGAGLPPKKSVENFKKCSKKFAGLIFYRTFAIPKQSGGGEMVDTLL